MMTHDDMTWTDKCMEIINEGCVHLEHAWAKLNAKFGDTPKTIRTLQRYLKKENSTWQNLVNQQSNTETYTIIPAPTNTASAHTGGTLPKQKINLDDIENKLATMITDDDVDPDLEMLSVISVSIRFMEFKKQQGTKPDETDLINHIDSIIEKIPPPPAINFDAIPEKHDEKDKQT